ncbi:MAG: phycobilisome degradation protein NblB [Dolichospermum sp.]
MPVSADTIKTLLDSDNLGDRLRAVNQIRELEPHIGLELIRIAIGDSNARVRYAAVSQMDTLGKQNLPLSLTILRGLLEDPEPDVQAAAADCLGALKLHDAFEDLQKLYQKTPEWLVQFSIIATLGELGDPRGFELLKEAISSDNGLIQTAAISSFGELGDIQAVPILVPYSTSADWQVRYRVVQALTRLDSEDAKAILANLVNDEVAAISHEAKKALQLF